jgi:asparagine synthase (glutamine-hydrolysing)
LLHNGDVHTMAYGLEARVPFADAELVTAAERIAPEVALQGGHDKWHLRQAMGGELPEAIRWRRKSALPKDQGAEPVYRAEATRLLREADPVVARQLDLARVAELANLPRPLAEVERASLFQAICFAHFCRHYRVR